jgi:hypothetical protein
MATATQVSPTMALDAKSSPRDEYRCQCGNVLRVFGLGRHRIYFPMANARLDEPVMDGRCPQCGRGLPGKNA